MEVLLGLLTIEPMSGYDLGQTIRASVGHFWNESYGQIYPNLKRLAAGGLVTSKTAKQKGKPDRHVYSITSKGRMRLAKWLAVEPQPEIPRNELLLKLFFGVQALPQTLIGYVERMAEREAAVLEELKRLQLEEIAQMARYPDAPYWKMAARFGQLELQAHLSWAQETLTALRAGVERGKHRTSTGKGTRHARK
jgi:DNA-binding PadR family transcriptional regulator